MFDVLIIDVHLATMEAAKGAAYGAVKDGAIGVRDGRIVFAGPVVDLPGPPETLSRRLERAGGRWATPGLIDCHTHLVFAGTRADEFEQRLKGATYADIARAGGGILSTVRATRAASLEELTALAAERMRRFLRAGVTTLEFKSGYGLDAQNEIKMLEAGSAAATSIGLRARRTFLPLHALPPEYSDDRQSYVAEAAEVMLDRACKRGLVDAVDVFCETIGFTLEETRVMFEAARARNIPVRLHAEQLSDMRGAGLAAQYSALSADHLEYANAADIAAMARSGTAAVLLPGAFYFLNETRQPPVDLLRKSGVPIAVASDFNPGSSPIMDPRLVMNMAATLFGLTPEEALAGMTRNAAAALGLDQEIGTLTIGKRADICLWTIAHPAELVYWIGGEGPDRVFIGGEEKRV